MVEILIVIVIGIGIGWGIAAFMNRSKQMALATQLEVKNREYDQLKEEKQALFTDLRVLQNQLEILHKQRQEETEKARKVLEQFQTEAELRRKEALDAKEQACQEMLASQKQHQDEAIRALKQEFEAIITRMEAQTKSATDEMLRQRQKEFAESSHQNLGQLVNPLRETIDKMQQAMHESTLKQTELGSAMKENIERMIRQSEAAQMSADELARVFKHGSKVQGDWGETVLDELLQSQGLTKGIHYDTQVSIRTNEGTLMRPDIILHLDQRREVVIDSKVSLTAFMDYVNADSEEERQRALRAHIDSIQKHVKELAAKDYAAYIQPPKVRMNYVIMFVPHTGALWTALNAQPDLWRRAMERGVFIADEQTLYAALHIIQLTWTQIAQAQNHEKVFALANEMIDRVGQFVKKYEDLGKALAKAQTTYDEAARKLAPQGQSILQTAGKLLKLGAKQSDKNPVQLTIEKEQEE